MTQSVVLGYSRTTLAKIVYLCLSGLSSNCWVVGDMEEVSKEGYVENMESSSSRLKSVGTNAQSFGCCE